MHNVILNIADSAILVHACADFGMWTAIIGVRLFARYRRLAFEKGEGLDRQVRFVPINIQIPSTNRCVTPGKLSRLASNRPLFAGVGRNTSARGRVAKKERGMTP